MRKTYIIRFIALLCSVAMLVSCQNPEQIPVDPGDGNT